MYKLLIHMGLPKTATTSLQNNFFMQLHKERKINFLGRAYTSLQKDYFNPFSEILEKLNYNLTPEDEFALREKFFTMLRDDKVNVISEESLTVTYNQRHDLIYRNLNMLTKGCDVNILLCLRSPIDFIYTYYIEAYRWHYHAVKEKSNIESFINDLCNNHDSVEYDSLFFGRLLEKIGGSFSNIDLYMFEDFVRDKEYFVSLSSKLMGLSIEDVQFVVNLEKVNSRKINHGGKESESITLNQKVPLLIGKLFSKEFTARLKKITVIKFLYMTFLVLLSKIKFKKSVVHPCLTYSQINKLSKLLLIDVEGFSNKYKLDGNKLIEYGYGVDNKSRPKNQN